MKHERQLTPEAIQKREAVKRAVEHKLFNLGTIARMKPEQKERKKNHE